MTLENNWRFKSLGSLEKKNFGQIPKDESSIVQRLLKLRQTPINDFGIDDIRFMIIQGVGLKYLLTEAIELLDKNILTEGNYYEGDLLNAVLKMNADQWTDLEVYWHRVDLLIKDKMDYLRTIRPKLEIDNFYSCKPK